MAGHALSVPRVSIDEYGRGANGKAPRRRIIECRAQRSQQAQLAAGRGKDFVRRPHACHALTPLTPHLRTNTEDSNRHELMPDRQLSYCQQFITAIQRNSTSKPPNENGKHFSRDDSCDGRAASVTHEAPWAHVSPNDSCRLVYPLPPSPPGRQFVGLSDR